MAITRDDVRHIALLARLPLSADEDGADQLDYIGALQRLDDRHRLSATAHIAPMATPFRDDVVTNPPDPGAWLANSPTHDGRFFKVPKIIE
jgi:aspartyl/glutamyl-tRNA(Asn/Gln) amidotransferase C subunit